MFGLGTTELILILVIVMVLFGAKKLPALGEGLAKGIKSFRTNISMDDKDKKDEDKIIDAEVPSAEKKKDEKSS
ncbi:MAG: twin-arginine translocase TatA/TatE family subunit [Ghiorsea sp.]|nr:twin-arginine translocase TatA/TatE family subunit [Ghiorsea sp.]MDQ6980463.1 twin-arginine translocase TatA/TatE family subunit [Ghiorsea sp.]MDQ7059046.1 twin-arginine translocase TatA/TatE family subunit [Ghiorsea sp.]